MKQQILIVDPNESFVNDFTNSLKEIMECEISHVTTGSQALNKIKTTRFSLIIIENTVTSMSGFELVGTLKSNLDTKLIPLIVLSEEKDPIIIKRYANLDVNEFMFKPLDKKIAIEKIDKILVKQRNKIMIIDDHAGIQTFLQRVIKTKFFRGTMTALDGNEALELLKAEIPSLIILDIAMPGMSGTEFIKELRGNEKYKNIPVVVLSSNTNAELIKEMAQFNISDYLAKPITIQELTVKLKKFFD